jgi:hypothetical protein
MRSDLLAMERECETGIAYQGEYLGTPAQGF